MIDQASPDGNQPSPEKAAQLSQPGEASYIDLSQGQIQAPQESSIGRSESEEFREVAEERGLILTEWAHKRHFLLDLNQGWIRIEQDLDKIWELAKLARDVAASDSYGEHNAILQLVVPREALETKPDFVIFERPHHVMARETLQNWVTMRNLLEEHGCDMSEIHRERKDS